MKRLRIFLLIQLSLLSGSMAALTLTNGEMTNASTGPGTAGNGTMTGWTNNVAGGFEAKSTAGPDFFGALVQSGGAAGSIGSTDNDWTDVAAGSVLILKFDLFNERLADGNGTTDVLAELLIDGIPKSSVSLLRAAETYDESDTRTTYNAPAYAVAADDIGKQVDVRFTATGADAAWHQTGIDNVEIVVDTNPDNELADIALKPTITYPSAADPIVISSAPVGTTVGTLRALTILGIAAEGVTYSLEAGAGDANNASYSIGGDAGNELLVAASLAGIDGVTHSVLVRATNDEEFLDMAVTFTVLLDSEPDGLIDAWENSFGTTADFSSGGDRDLDGLEDQDEFTRGTSPIDPDTDDDGKSDGEEIADGTDPLDPLSFRRAPLSVLNGSMTNTGIAQIPNWLNTGVGNLEGKTDTNGANDNFGALVFSGGLNGTTGATNNEWTGVTAGQLLTLKFELFNERLADANGTTDIRAELLVAGGVKSSVDLTRAVEIYDETGTRTPYSAPSYAVAAEDIGQQVDVRFTATAADEAWHQTGIDNVALELSTSGPGVDFVITAINETEAGPMITFTTTSGSTYFIYRSTDLSSWVELADDFPSGGATGEPTDFTDSLFNTDFPDGAVRVFYRVKKSE